jgi:hypothetical protein
MGTTPKAEYVDSPTRHGPFAGKKVGDTVWMRNGKPAVFAGYDARWNKMAGIRGDGNGHKRPYAVRVPSTDGIGTTLLHYDETGVWADDGSHSQNDVVRKAELAMAAAESA